MPRLTPIATLLLFPALVSAAETSVEHIQVHHHQAYRGNVPAEHLPQAIDVLSRDEFDQLALTRFQDALDNSASIARQNNGGGLWDSYSLRGFPGNENMPSGYLINGFNGGRGFSGHRDLSNVEYVEILKGPGSALYGRSEPGGTINIVTRKPAFDTQGYIKASHGRFEQNRVEADYTTGLSEDLAFRVNGAVQDYGSFRDYVNSDKKVITPSLLWQINSDSSLLYEFEYLEQSQLFDRGLVVLNNNFDSLPRERYLGEPTDGPTEISARGHQLTFQQDLANGWAFNAGISYRDSDLSGFSSDAELAVARQSIYDDGQTLTRQRRFRDYWSEDLSVRAEISGSLQLLGLEHNLMLGADGYDYDLYNYLGRYRGAKGSYAINIFNPQYGVAVPGTVNPLYANLEHQKAYGVYIQDIIRLHQDWQLLIGLRLDKVKQSLEEQVNATFADKSFTERSPRLGLVYDVTPHLQWYASYSEGFLPLSGADYLGRGFDPESSRSKEMGLKWHQDGASWTLAVFDGTKTNILTSDPINVGFAAPLGEAQSTGVELDLSYPLTEDLKLDLSYAWLDTRTLNNALSLDWGVEIPAGSRLVNVPKHTASLALNQHFAALGFSHNAGVRWRYQSERLGDSVQPSYLLPSYSLTHLFLHTELDANWQLELNIDNLFDKNYVLNSYSALWTVPGEPRSYRVGVRYGF
ncbi:TonB-dependent siderophore receptor [Rheinheimera sp.]|uniref:TonB-dependent siderophore receptor n=1 Tax=Rheinheimera sp. TaxID=1869214 RepID=UPI003AF430A6